VTARMRGTMSMRKPPRSVLPALVTGLLLAVSAVGAYAVTTPATAPNPANAKPIVPQDAAPLSGGDPFVLLPGTWDWANQPGTCQDNPQTFTLSADRTHVLLEYRKPVPSFGNQMRKSATYKILDANNRLLRAQVEGETRKTPSGAPVVWDFAFLSNNSFCWHRTDWPKGTCTKVMVRCSALAKK